MTFRVLLEKIRLQRAAETYAICRRLLGMIWSMDKVLFLGSVVTILIPAVIPFINAYIYKLVIDAVIAGIDAGTVDWESLSVLLIVRLSTYFAQDAAFSTQSYVEQLLWTKFPIYLSERLFSRLSELDIERFEEAAFRDKMEQVKDAAYRPQRLISSLLFALQSIVQFSIAFVALLTLNWVLIFLVALIALPEFIYRLYEDRAGWVIWAWHSPRKKRFNYLAHLLQNAQSTKELRIFGLAPLFVQETVDVQEEFFRENKKLSTRAYIFRLIFNALSTCLFVGVEVYVIMLAVARRVTVGDISFYTQIVTNFQNGLGGVLRNISDIFESSLYVRSLFNIIDAPLAITSPPGARVLSMDTPPRITFEHVTFRYPGTEKPTLEDFSLEIRPGEKVAFVGENGAGKTTVVKLLSRFYDPAEGRILIDGTDLREIDLKSWHRHLAILFQDFNRYEDTAKKNIYFGNVRKAVDMREIERAAADAGADTLIAALEKGYDQMLGRMFEAGEELSVGQWQKVALARAYFRNAPVLILDEPTAAIDAKAEAEIFQRVEELSRDKTVLLISHRFSTVRMADRIVVLKDGGIVEQGSHEALIAQKGLYAELFSLQAKGYR